ncbi:hypothetical protein QUF90_16230 [Desulfococcaceae bacterium HSG9]|nr:hypothetical protein [Desulfococcaceae bacterium HSG9]
MMKPDKMIFLIISAFALIAVTGYATPTIDVGLILDSYNGAAADDDDFDHHNIGLFIEEDGRGNLGRVIQGGSPAANFGKGVIHEFVFQFNNVNSDFTNSYASDMEIFSVDNSGPLRNDGWTTAQYNSGNNLKPWQPLSSHSVTANCTHDTKPDDSLKSNLGNNFLEGAVDMELLADELSNME